MIAFSRTAAAMAGLLLATACGSAQQAAIPTGPSTAKAPASASAPTAAATPPPPPPRQKGTGISLDSRNKAVQPCSDFFQYANGNWIKNNPSPAAEVRWGSFNELADRNNAILRKILEDAAKNPGAPGT